MKITFLKNVYTFVVFFLFIKQRGSYIELTLEKTEKSCNNLMKLQ